MAPKKSNMSKTSKAAKSEAPSDDAPTANGTSNHLTKEAREEGDRKSEDTSEKLGSPVAEVQPQAQLDVHSEHKQDTAENGTQSQKRKADTEQPAYGGTKTSDAALGGRRAQSEAKHDKITEKPLKKHKAEPSKQPRESSRKSGRYAQKSQPSQEQLVRFLLSDEAADLCRPEDELQDLKERGQDAKTYSSSVLSPFEELLCAMVLSRPISHRLGMRTIRTLLNDPYNFTTPKAIIDAGKEKRHQALWDAKTQHKDKTAEQIGLIAEVVSTKFAHDPTDTSLNKVKELEDWDGERDVLQKSIKGLGKTGLDIFFRRVQWLWEGSYPFLDERTARGIGKLGLPKDADQLVKVLDQHWSTLDIDHLAGDDIKVKKRRAFVVLCERATGADLEGKSEVLVEAAASA